MLGKMLDRGPVSIITSIQPGFWLCFFPPLLFETVSLLVHTCRKYILVIFQLLDFEFFTTKYFMCVLRSHILTAFCIALSVYYFRNIFHRRFIRVHGMLDLNIVVADTQKKIAKNKQTIETKYRWNARHSPWTSWKLSNSSNCQTDTNVDQWENQYIDEPSSYRQKQKELQKYHLVTWWFHGDTQKRQHKSLSPFRSPWIAWESWNTDFKIKNIKLKLYWKGTFF